MFYVEKKIRIRDFRPVRRRLKNQRRDGTEPGEAKAIPMKSMLYGGLCDQQDAIMPRNRGMESVWNNQVLVSFAKPKNITALPRRLSTVHCCRLPSKIDPCSMPTNQQHHSYCNCTEKTHRYSILAAIRHITPLRSFTSVHSRSTFLSVPLVYIDSRHILHEQLSHDYQRASISYLSSSWENAVL
jgi:hypothetical protein